MVSWSFWTLNASFIEKKNLPTGRNKMFYDWDIWSQWQPVCLEEWRWDFKPENTVEHGGGSITLWGCFAASWNSDDGGLYLPVLELHMKTKARWLKQHNRTIIPNTCKSWVWLTLSFLDSLPKAPIANHSTFLTMLKSQFCQEEWSNIQPEVFHKLVGVTSIIYSKYSLLVSVWACLDIYFVCGREKIQNKFSVWKHKNDQKCKKSFFTVHIHVLVQCYLYTDTQKHT